MTAAIEFSRAARRFDSIGQLQPGLSQDRLAPVEILGVKARDGVMLTAYLTIPLASGPRPLIVMPHGGPELRDRVDFDRFAQIFAAQGWMVLQPNFRGSGGYGQAFAKAGKKHWGDLMQADVEDAVAQVLASGRVDATRIAICGASYGGYAALAGATRELSLVIRYGEAVAVNGVSFTVDRGELAGQAANQLGNQNLTVSSEFSLANNQLAGFSFGNGDQNVGRLDGNELGRIWGGGTLRTLTVGNNNATGGNFAGVFGQNFVGTTTGVAINLAKAGSGTQIFSGRILGTGGVTVVRPGSETRHILYDLGERRTDFIASREIAIRYSGLTFADVWADVERAPRSTMSNL